MAVLLTPEFTKALAGRLIAIRNMPPPIPPKDRHAEDLTKITTDGFLTVRGKTYHMTAKARWGTAEDGSTELDLFCLNDASRMFLEWWHDGIELQCQVSRTRLTLGDLGLSPHTVKNLGDESELRWSGTVYYYDMKDYVPYQKEGEEDPDEPYLYVFKTEDGGRSLSIQVWGDEGEETYDVWASEVISPRSVEVLHLGTGAS